MKKKYSPPRIAVVKIIGELTILQISGIKPGYDSDDDGGFFEMDIIGNEKGLLFT